MTYLLTEAPLAKLTHKRLLASVGENVSLDFARCGETFVTISTLEPRLLVAAVCKTGFVYSQCTRVLCYLTCPGGGGHEVLTGFRAGQTLDLCWIVDGGADHLLCRGARGRLYAFHVDQVSCLPRVDSHRLAQITVKGMHFFV